MRTFLRAIQTFFPYLQDIRFSLKLLIIKITKIPHEYDFYAIKKFKPEFNQVFIDVGSNRGEAISSMLIEQKFKNRIIGFEPNQLIFAKLSNNFIGNNRVVLNNYGLGDINQDLDLYVPFYRKWMFDGLSSLKYEAAEGWLRTRLWRFNEKYLTVKSISCQVRKLDDFNLNPYFIKIDVQGFELEVLLGGIQTVEKYKPILLIESISSEVIKLLEELDYQFYQFSKGNFLPGEGSLNTYCITKEKYKDLIPASDI